MNKPTTIDKISTYLQTATEPQNTAQIAEAVGVARKTVQTNIKKMGVTSTKVKGVAHYMLAQTETAPEPAPEPKPAIIESIQVQSPAKVLYANPDLNIKVEEAPTNEPSTPSTRESLYQKVMGRAERHHAKMTAALEAGNKSEARQWKRRFQRAKTRAYNLLPESLRTQVTTAVIPAPSY
jgi:hypothetical protein